MNDRFRFRAWNKEEKEYYYDAEKTYDYFNGIMSESFGELLEDDRYIVEQCTGIRDRNNNLIYEGDLIRLIVDEKIIYQGVVEWYSGYGKYSGLWQVVNFWSDGTIKETWNIFSSDWEIIGNIHDNIRNN